MQAAYFGMVLGFLLLVAKAGSFWLLTSVKNKKTGEMEQRVLRKWIIFGEKMPLRDRIHESTLLLFFVDVLGGYMGIHVLGAMGGGVIATVGIATYTIVCMAMLMKQFIANWLGKKLKFKKKSKKQKWSWQEAT
jgi:hypothetical protein